MSRFAPADLTFQRCQIRKIDRAHSGPWFSVQGGYPFSERLQLGGNYTWSQTEGNVTAEERGSGPVTERGPDYYPEFTRFAQNNPAGFLRSDQTHKVRAWGTLAIPTAAGHFVLSALHRFDSGTAYSAPGTVNFVASSRFEYAKANGYAGVPSTIDYYFSDRGQYRWDDVHSTDLSLNYRIRLAGRAELFVQPEIINVFNNDAVFAGHTSVFTFDNDKTLQPFNPFTETPVEGVHYRLHEEFGQDRDNYLDFQQARTYRVSVGIRF
ncbi:MAG TPA: hypothetical protein VMS98_08065 [Thermoanaerobaculia bacterium]|nr:hypothetical protein [Thermoanaerobaculia bacterium]